MDESENSTANDNFILYAESRIVQDKRVTFIELKIMLYISNFLRRDGYATCSNEWLEERLECNERTIRSGFESLEAKGYLWREVWKDGMTTHRRLWIPCKYNLYLQKHGLQDEAFKKCLREGVQTPVERVYTPSSRGRTDPPNKKEEHNRKETTTGAGQLLSLFDKRKEIFKGIGDEEIALVKETFEASKTPIASPDGWIAQCLREGWHKKKVSSTDILKRNKSIGDRMEPAKKLFASKNLSVTSSPTSFEIAYVGAQKEPTIFAYIDPMFEEKIRKFFASLGIPMGECVVEQDEKGNYLASFKRTEAS